MKCPWCSHRFQPNWRNPGPLESLETPGGMLLVLVFVIAGSMTAHVIDLETLAFAGYSIAGLLLVPFFAAWHNCRKIICPQCDEKITGKPWHM
jgi:hypothetical protein